MTTLLALILFASAALLCVVAFQQARRDTVDLLSVRNFFLFGILIFQFVSGAVSLYTLDFSEYYVNNPALAGTVFTIVLLMFVGIFWFAYSRGWVVRRLPWRLPMSYPVASPMNILPMATVIVIAGIVMRIGIGRNVPILGVLGDVAAVGLLAGAAGLAMWVWAPRLWNPAVAIPAAIIILIAIGALVFQTFGRRDVLSALVAILFAGYHSHWKDMGLARTGLRLAILGTVALVFFAAFSTVRSTTHKHTDFGSLVSGIAEGDVKGGIMEIGSGQYAGAISMWAIETRPLQYPFSPLSSAIHLIIQPIPRAIWPDKPIGLGREMVGQARIYRPGRDFTIGPGLVGHIWHDNPLLSLIPYALLLGLLVRFLDEHVRVHPKNPFVVIPVIVGIGDLVGVPRGELSLFLFRSLVAMATAWVGLRISWRLLMLVSPAAASTNYEQQEWAEEGEGEYADVAADGDDALPQALARPE